MTRRLLVFLCLLLLLAVPALGEICVEGAAGTDGQNQLNTDVYIQSRATLEFYKLSADTTGVIGRALTLKAYARGYNTLHYQWYLDGALIAGASGSVSPRGMQPGDGQAVSAILNETQIPIKISDFQKSDAGRYTIVVWDDFGNEMTSDMIVVGYRYPSLSSDPIPQTGDDGVAMNLLLGLMLCSGTGFFALLMRLIHYRKREAANA